MSIHSYRGPTLTIANGATNSGALGNLLRKARALRIFAPATLPETITVFVSVNGVDWVSTGTTLSAGEATLVEFPASQDMRLTAGAAVGADRVFEVYIVEQM